MLFGVPQYIDVEDKIVGPLTVKHLVWLGAMGAIMIILWMILDPLYFYVAAIPVGLIFLAFAFYRPQGRTMLSFVTDGIFFFTRPRMYIWKRSAEVRRKKKIKKKEPEKKIVQKKVTYDQIHELAKMLDAEPEEEMRAKQAKETQTRDIKRRIRMENDKKEVKEKSKERITFFN